MTSHQRRYDVIFGTIRPQGLYVSTIHMYEAEELLQDICEMGSNSEIFVFASLLKRGQRLKERICSGGANSFLYELTRFRSDTSLRKEKRKSQKIISLLRNGRKTGWFTCTYTCTYVQVTTVTDQKYFHKINFPIDFSVFSCLLEIILWHYYSMDCNTFCTGYSRTSMARTPLGSRKLVRDRGSSS